MKHLELDGSVLPLPANIKAVAARSHAWIEGRDTCEPAEIQSLEPGLQQDRAQSTAEENQVQMGLWGAPTECLEVLSFPQCPCGRAAPFRGAIPRAHTQPWAAAARGRQGMLRQQHLCHSTAVWQGRSCAPCSCHARASQNLRVTPRLTPGMERLH